MSQFFPSDCVSVGAVIEFESPYNGDIMWAYPEFLWPFFFDEGVFIVAYAWRATPPYFGVRSHHKKIMVGLSAKKWGEVPL